MKRFILLTALAAGACARTADAVPPEAKAVPVLDGARMPAYMEVLPRVLKESELFINSPKGKASAGDPDNRAFYRHLYGLAPMAEALRKAGFPDEGAFGSHHELVVALFITLSENPNLLKDAEIQLPALQKELDALTLKKSRDKNNASLNTTHARLQAQVDFYKNLTTLAPYADKLRALNSPAP